MYINREQQIPALRSLHAPFIKMASFLPCERTNRLRGSAVPDGVVSRAPGAVEAQWLRGALGLLLCLTGALEQESVPVYFGSGGTDGGKCASGSVWDVLELLRPLCGQHASAEVRAKLYPPFQLGCSGDAAALWPKPSLSSLWTWGSRLHLVPVQRVGGWLGIVQTTQQRVAAMKTRCC